MVRIVSYLIGIWVVVGLTGCSDFLSVDDEPPVQINFSEIMYFPDDTLYFTIRNNTGETILLDGCNPDIRYTFEIFEEGVWIPYTTINYGECPEERTPWVSLDPGDELVEEVDLEAAEIEPGFYRVALQYRHEDDTGLIEVHSDGITVTDGETF